MPKENNKTVHAVVKLWQETVINSELSRDNIRRRVNFGDLMSDYPIGKLIVNDVKAKDVVAFYRSVKEKRNLTRKTILSYHSHMKNFFFWAIQNDFASATPIHESMVTTIFPKNDSKVFDVACISEENITGFLRLSGKFTFIRQFCDLLSQDFHKKPSFRQVS